MLSQNVTDNDIFLLSRQLNDFGRYLLLMSYTSLLFILIKYKLENFIK